MKRVMRLGAILIALLAFASYAYGNTGGPDVFGHVWKDNLEPGGPTFNYINITGTGTLLGNGDQVAFGPLQMGFTFPFYRGEYDSLWVNTNGIITFTERITSSSNYCPVPGTNREYWVAPFWDDLDVRADSGGAVYYQHFDAEIDYLIIQWNRFIRRTEGGTPMDMEAILYQNGVIVFQYNVINSTARGQGQEATIGIQDDATDGLTYMCNFDNPAYALHGGLAVGWYPPVIDHDIRAISLDAPTENLAVVGAHLNVAATFSNTGNFSENFSAYLEVRNSSNTLVYNTSFPMTLAVGASSQATFASWTTSQADSFSFLVFAGLSGDQRSYNDSLSGYFRTVNAVALPVTEDFEGTFPPEGWTVINRGGEEPWRTNTTHYRSATHSGWASYDWIENADDWLVMAPINMTLSSNITWLYYEDQTGWLDDGVRHSFYVSTGEFFDPDAATPIAIHTPADHQIAGFLGDPVTFDLDAYAGNSHVWLAYRLENISGLGVEHWWIDDISVYNVPNADIGVKSINSPIGGVRENCDTPLLATVRNYGLQMQIFDVGVIITGESQGVIYGDTVTGVALAPEAQQLVSFATLEDPQADNYTMTVSVLLPSDENPANNSSTAPFYVSTIIEHFWDDNGAEYSYVPYPFNNAMAAVKFTPFDVDFTILSGSIYVRDYSEDSTGYAEFEWVAFCPDNAGAPDIANAFAVVPHVGTYVVPTLIPLDIPDIVMEDYQGDVWIVAKYAEGTTYFPAIGDDSSEPDGKSYSNTSGEPPIWNLDPEHDYMMRIEIQYSPCSDIVRCDYIPGDLNDNGAANGIDVTFGVAYLKGGTLPPVNCAPPAGPCPQGDPFFAAGDVNGSCAFNGIDITFFIAYLKALQPALLYCPTCPPPEAGALSTSNQEQVKLYQEKANEKANY